MQTVHWIDGFHTECEGRNGGGDPWHTDGRLAVILLRSALADDSAASVMRSRVTPAQAGVQFSFAPPARAGYRLAPV